MRWLVASFAFWAATAALGQEEKPINNYRKIESALIAGHGVVAIASILRKSLRRVGVPAAAILGATGYLMRTIRLAKNPPKENARYALAMNALFIPLTIIAAGHGLPLFQKGWQSLIPFATQGATWRQKMVSVSSTVPYIIYTATDTASYIRRDFNPLQHKQYYINRLYGLLGVILYANTLNNSGTVGGRVVAMIKTSVAYSLFSSWVQEFYYMAKHEDVDVRALRFDQAYGAWHSMPRGLIEFYTWNKLASAVRSLPDAVAIGGFLTALKMVDTIQRSDLFARGKLIYTEDKKGYWTSIKLSLEGQLKDLISLIKGEIGNETHQQAK